MMRVAPRLERSSFCAESGAKGAQRSAKKRERKTD